MNSCNYNDGENESCNYEVFNLIGEGSFGKVYKARCRRTNQIVAYKVISKNGRKRSEVHALREECKIQRYLQHPNIIRMLDSFETETKLVVITEFAQKDLCRVLKEDGVFPEIKAQKVLVNLVAALRYLHSNRVLHRDLKPQNVLLDINGIAKLCDFGFAKSLGNDLKVLTSIKGTPLYMAPELMNESPYDHNADLWSLGCIAYELVTGHTPYTTSSILELIKMVKFKQIKWPNYLSEVCLSFLKGLLQKNPQQRLSWPYLLLHPFVSFAFYPPVPDYSQTNLCYPLPMNAYNFVPIQPPLANILYEQNLRLTPETNVHYRNLNVRDQPTSVFNKSKETPVELPTNDSTDPAFAAQKEEWMEFLKKTISDVMYVGDVDVLIQKPSLMLIMNAFNSCRNCSTIVITVTRLLSLPFVVELVSETQLTSIKQNYSDCGIMKDLVNVVKQIVVEIDSKKDTDYNRETAVQHLLLIICNLTFAEQRFLKQFFSAGVSLNLFKTIKSILSIRTKHEPLSVVKYAISVFLRLYTIVPQSRPLIVSTFQNCVPEFHSLLGEQDDITAKVRLCIFITLMGCTNPNFFNNTSGVDSLIEDLDRLKINFSTPSVQQATEGALQVLKNSTVR